MCLQIKTYLVWLSVMTGPHLKGISNVWYTISCSFNSLVPGPTMRMVLQEEARKQCLAHDLLLKSWYIIELLLYNCGALYPNTSVMCTFILEYTILILKVTWFGIWMVQGEGWKLDCKAFAGQIIVCGILMSFCNIYH